MAGSARVRALARVRREPEAGTGAEIAVEAAAGAEGIFLLRRKEVIAAIATSKYCGSYSERLRAKKFPRGRIFLKFSIWRAVPECETID
jgi:hypothetical protein